MEELPLPIEISKQVWMIPCRVSNDAESFKPLIRPIGKLDEPIPKKKKWKEEEEALLATLANKTKRWSAIAKEINISLHSSVSMRDGKQCREHWNNHINPQLKKDKWTNDEDCIIIENFKIYGKKWAKIAGFLLNRTENQVKNRWKSLQSKSKDQGFYAYPICSMNLNKLGNIEPIGIDHENTSPTGSFKLEEPKLTFMFEDKSPFTSMTSFFESYYTASQNEQIINSMKILDTFVQKQ